MGRAPPWLFDVCANGLAEIAEEVELNGGDFPKQTVIIRNQTNAESYTLVSNEDEATMRALIRAIGADPDLAEESQGFGRASRATTTPGGPSDG